MLTLVLTWTIVTFSILYFVYRMKKWNDYRILLNTIPGPPTWPILGNVDIVCGKPEECFKKLRNVIKQYRPIGRSWVGHVDFVNFASAEDTELLISTTKHNSKGYLYNFLHVWLGKGLLTSSGDKWQIRRKILTPSFHFNILQDFLQVFIEQSNILIEDFEKISDKTCIDIMPYITEFTLHSICETAMGTSISTFGNKYKQCVYKMCEYIVYRIRHPWFVFDLTFALTPGFWDQKCTAKYLHNVSYKVIEDRKKKFFDDVETTNSSYTKRKKMAMLDILISAKRDGADIDDEGIREEVDTFMFEGHDTTSMAICFALMLLACHTDIQDNVYFELKEIFGDSERDPTYNDIQEMKYLERCLKESLRLYPSVPLIARECSEEFTSHDGHTVPKGTNCVVHVYDLHRDPLVFPDPEKFDPDRFLPENTLGRHPFAYIPFSAGPRNCIGQKFAMIELKTVISKIIRNFILEPIDTPENIVLLTDIVIRPKEGIKMKLTPR